MKQIVTQAKIDALNAYINTTKYFGWKAAIEDVMTLREDRLPVTEGFVDADQAAIFNKMPLFDYTSVRLRHPTISYPTYFASVNFSRMQVKRINRMW